MTAQLRPIGRSLRFEDPCAAQPRVLIGRRRRQRRRSTRGRRPTTSPDHALARRRDTLISMRAFIFDLDGTLVDTVYAHVVAWQQALDEAGIGIDGWRIHRRVGMSGGLFTRAVAREIGRPLSLEEQERLQRR